MLDTHVPDLLSDRLLLVSVHDEGARRLAEDKVRGPFGVSGDIASQILLSAYRFPYLLR